MIGRIYWTCCVLMVFLAANLVALGDDCACVASIAENPTQPPKPATVDASDASTDFLIALNAQRVSYGLQPVVGSLAMEGTAARNNAIQLHRGLGHWVLDGFGQCAGMGYSTMPQALTAWLNSPAHRAIILAPDLSMIGYHQSGTAHTVSTLQGGPTNQPKAPAPPPVETGKAPVGNLGAGQCGVCPCPGCACRVRPCATRRGFRPFRLFRFRVSIQL